MSADAKYSDIPELISKLSKEHVTKYGHVLQRIYDLGDAKLASFELGKARPFAYQILWQMRKRYTPEFEPKSRDGKEITLQQVGLTRELAYRTIKRIAGMKRAPTAALRAAETVLKAQGELGGNPAIGGVPGKSFGINVSILSDAGQFAHIMAGGTYKTEPVATNNEENEVSPMESVKSD